MCCSANSRANILLFFRSVTRKIGMYLWFWTQHVLLFIKSIVKSDIYTVNMNLHSQRWLLLIIGYLKCEKVILNEKRNLLEANTLKTVLWLLYHQYSKLLEKRIDDSRAMKSHLEIISHIIMKKIFGISQKLETIFEYIDILN